MSLQRRPVLIGVIGAGQASAEGYRQAREVGRLLAARDVVLVCGGLGGIMEGAARGCREAGGDVIGILPGDSAETANPYINLPVVTAMGHARNVIIAHTACGLIAVEGEYGTLAETAIALKLGKPVVQLNSWPGIDATARAGSPEQAVTLIFDALQGAQQR